MENDNIYVVLANDTNLNYDNKPNKFTVEFETPLNFPKQTKCALYDILLSELVSKIQTLSNYHNLYILCNIVSESYKNEYKKNILRLCSVYKNGNLIEQINPIVYVSLQFNNINRISIEIVDENLNPIHLNGNSCVILHFKCK
jgi:hypothetical protein